MNSNTDDLSIYLHWPFCRSKCPYCDFFSRVKKNVDQDTIVDSYINQLDRYAELIGRRKIISIFFGGGTPSLLKPQNIARLIDKIAALWPLDNQIEISLEANPNTQTPTLFADLKSAGINRLSLGVQSLDDAELKFLGRTHTAAEALHSIEQILKFFANQSVDLMYALPQQTLDSWQQSLNHICAFGLKHISLYQLTIEENTPFYRKGIKPLDEEAAALLYRLTDTQLSAAGYERYEVSNHALPGFQSRHNQTYWQGKDYIGIGETAHGRLKIDNKIFAVTDPLQFEPLTPQERAEELIIMGLRLKQGIDKKTFRQNCGLSFGDVINQKFKQLAITQNLLTETTDNLRATAEGFLLLDYLITGLSTTS